MTKALVVFSGGQDSTTCLLYALNTYDMVWTIGFNYGQRHSVELKCRKEILSQIIQKFPDLKSKLKDDRVIDITSLKDLTDSALTQDSGEYVIDKKNNLPTSFVPGRNLIFLCYAASYAYTIGADTVITGVGQADYSGYPDCRKETILALERAVNLGMESRITFETPLMDKTKAQTFAMAYELGGEEYLKLIIEMTHTCYKGNHDVLHEWGYGCAECPACLLRKQGYEEFKKQKSL
ncbi:MAG: 7-cyano-7-deazaguanine synthase QueC [Succinivibrio sp.]